MGIISVPHTLNIRFTKYRWFPIILFVGALIAVLAGWYTKGLKLGADFKGGVVIEARMPGKADVNALRKKFEQRMAQEISIQSLGGDGRGLIIRTESPEEDGHKAQISEKDKAEGGEQKRHIQDIASAKIVKDIKAVLGDGVEYGSVETMGPSMGAEIARNGIKGLIGTLIGIMVYIWFRFEWQFGVCGIISLLHDCIVLMGFFIFSQKEFGENGIVALVITASYSIHDTVVIFDRVRENKIFMRGAGLHKILDTSTNETLPRTILTSFTTILALFVLWLFGGRVVGDFSLPIMVGMIIGTYSSIVLSVPLLQFFPGCLQRVSGVRVDMTAGQ